MGYFPCSKFNFNLMMMRWQAFGFIAIVATKQFLANFLKMLIEVLPVLSNPWKTNYEVINDGYFKQSDVDYPKEFLLKWKTECMVYHFISDDVKNQQISLVYGLFSQINMIKRTIIVEVYHSLKMKRNKNK